MNRRWIRYFPSYFRKKIDGNDNLQKILGNIFWLCGDRALRMGLGLPVAIWIARYLGPYQYGFLNYAYAFVALFSAMATFGLDSIIVRNIVHKPLRKNKVLGTSFALKLVGGLITLGLAISGSLILRPNDEAAHWLIGIIAAGTLFQAFDTIDFWFQSQLQSKYTVIARNVGFLFGLSAKVSLIVLVAPLAAFAWVGTAELAVGAIGLVVLFEISGGRIRQWKISRKVASGLLKDSWPLLLSSMVGFIFMRIDQVMIGSMLGPEEVGVYSAAVKISEVWYFMPMAIISSVYPRIVELKRIKESLFLERLQKLYNLMALLSYGVAIPTTFLSGYIVAMFFGNAYIKAAPVLAVLVWANLLMSLSIARSAFLTASNWTKVHLVTHSLGCLLNVVLNYFLIPRYGAMGAAIASCASFWFLVHGTCFLYRPLNRTGYMLTKAMIFPKVW